MLRRLFKGRHPLTHPDPAVRRAAVGALDDAAAESLAADLLRLVREDPDREVRLACLTHVRDRALLESLRDDPQLGDAAARRLRALAADADGPADPVFDPARLLALPVPEAAARIQSLQDVDELVALALKARGELRQVVLDHPLLSQPAALTTLEKRSRDHDKSLNRHARTLLDRWKRLGSEAQALRARAEELSAALGRKHPAAQDQAWRERQHQLHARLEETLDAYRALGAQLEAFGDPLPDLEALRGDPQALPPLNLPEPEPEPELEPGGPAEAAAASAEDPFEALVQGFVELDAALTSGRPFAEMAAQRQALTDRWLTAADHRPPSEAQHQVFETVSHRFRELADAMERLGAAALPPLPAEPLSIGAPEDTAAHRALWDAVAQRRGLHRHLEQIRRNARWPQWAPPTAEYARLLEAAGALRAELEWADGVLGDELRRLDEQLAALATAIDEGHLTTARSLLATARTLHDALPAAAVRSQGKELGRQAARLAELKDWQTFATSPKREALVHAMESLVASPLAPREQADRIKELRAEWQALGPVTQAADGRLADRFNAEAEKAFEPCRAYFAEQAQARKHNLAERRRICDQLEQYLAETDWAHADMKAAERIMRAARDEWRLFHPVDRNPGRTVELRFEELQGRLHDLVKAEWDRNLKAKEDIVAEAERLLGADLPVHAKVAEAKRLQHQWREVGITPRRPDQRLWRAFRAACDSIFSAREESRHAADAAVNELESRLAAELETFAKALDGLEPRSASAGDLRQLRHSTADIDRLPAGRRRALAERRAELVSRYSALLEEQQRAGRREQLLALKRWDEAMTNVEAARRTGADLALPEPPSGAADLLAARLASGGPDVPRELARRLAVKAELAAGRESPAEDEPLRLEVQVERLQAGLSGGRGASQDPYAIAESWCRLGPKDDSLAPLRERLFAALTSLL